MTGAERLEAAVWEVLDRAYASGYRDFLMGDAETVAVDLLDYDVAFSGLRTVDVVPYIEGWQISRGK